MPMQMPSPDKLAGGIEVSMESKNKGCVTLKYPILTKSNYTVWALKMRVNLQAQGVWDAIEHSDDIVEECKDRLGLAAIYQGVPEDVILMLAKKDSAKAAWETLRTMHMCAERVKEAKVQNLRTEFENMKMKDGESVDDFAIKLTTIITGIRSLGNRMEEIYVVKKFLRAIPPRLMQIVTSIEQFGDLKNMSVEEVVGRLKSHEERIRGNGDKDDEKHLLLTHAEWLARMKNNSGGDISSSGSKGHGGFHMEGRGSGCSGGRGHGRGRRGGRDNLSTAHDVVNPRKDKSMIKCYSCDKYEHYASECRNKKRDEEAKLTCKYDKESTLLLTKKIPNQLMLNEEKVMLNLLTTGED